MCAAAVFADTRWDAVRAGKAKPTFIPGEDQVNAIDQQDVRERTRKNIKKFRDEKPARATAVEFGFTAWRQHEAGIVASLAHREAKSGVKSSGCCTVC